MTDPLISKRLMYRAVEVPDDVDFYYGMKSDNVASINVSHVLPRPTSRAAVEKFLRESAEKALLMVVICLRSAEEASATATAHSTDVNNDRGNVHEVQNGKEDRAKPTPIGILFLGGGQADMRHHRAAMIGIEMHQDHRNNGYGTEAIEWVLEWGFELAGLHRIAIGTASFNMGAKRLYERMGFVHECTKRESLFHKGKFHDFIEWALLEHEWRERVRKQH